MAYSATKSLASVFGNKRVEGYVVTADAASGAVATGLSVIEHISMSPISMATAAIKIRKNLSDASAVVNGSVMIDDAASGDDFFITVFGR